MSPPDNQAAAGQAAAGPPPRRPAAPAPGKTAHPGTPSGTQAPLAPPRSAVALAYQNGDAAPRVVASGKGLIADQIIERAREHGVFVHESKELVSLLMQVDLDREIPPALYRAVAELLAWLHRIEAGGLPLESALELAPAPDLAATLGADDAQGARDGAAP